MFSDSSTDSDSGIRFKTTSTRELIEKRALERRSPQRIQRITNICDRGNERPKDSDKHRRNDSRSNDSRSNDRRFRKHSDRKSSPEHQRGKDSTKDEKSHYRNSDRSRSRQESKRFRSPLHKNGSRRRSISGDRKRGRRVIDNKSSLDVKLQKDVSTSKHSDRHRTETTVIRTNSDRNIVKENNNKSRININVKVEQDTGTKKVNISDTKRKYDTRDNEPLRSSTDTHKYRERTKYSPRRHEHIPNEKQTITTEHKSLQKDSTVKDNTSTKISKRDFLTDKKDDGDTELLNQLKAKANEEQSAKDKSKKSKHTKHSKKHKKEKLDLSEGELTPSDYDISFNDSELDKASPGRKSIKSDIEASCRRPIGPEIPEELRGELGHASADVIEISDSGHISSDEDAFGPLPSFCTKVTKAHLDLEERALKIRMEKLQEIDIKDEKNREEWMLELPDVQATHLGLGPRKFRAREGPDMSDRSSWTDTPMTKGAKSKETESQASKRIAEEAHRQRIQEKDLKQEKLIKKHKKKHKRDESLLDLHQKKLRKKKKKDKDAGLSTERRRFDREVDLGVNRFDEAQKKSIIKKAQLLDTRFSQGESKFL